VKLSEWIINNADYMAIMGVICVYPKPFPEIIGVGEW